MFALVTHAFFKKIDPVKVSIFLKELERHMIETNEKKKDLSPLTLAPYTLCIARTILKRMVIMWEFETIAPEKTA